MWVPMQQLSLFLFCFSEHIWLYCNTGAGETESIAVLSDAERPITVLLDSGRPITVLPGAGRPIKQEMDFLVVVKEEEEEKSIFKEERDAISGNLEKPTLPTLCIINMQALIHYEILPTVCSK